jgi:hypothetical protein
MPTRNQTAKTTAQTLFDNFIVHYGIPQRIHSDQGANFECKIVKELCTLTGRLSMYAFGRIVTDGLYRFYGDGFSVV